MRVIGIVLFVLALAAPAAAQRSVIVAGGLDYVSYETDDPNLSDLAKMLGFIADASVEITPWLHMAGQVSRIGSSARLFCVDDIDGPCVDARVSALTTAVGPRLRFQINEQTHGFAHVLLGSQRGSGTVSADLGGAFDTGCYRLICGTRSPARCMAVGSISSRNRTRRMASGSGFSTMRLSI